MKAIKYLIILSVTVFIFSACTKQIAGPTGPAGAQGPQGPSSSYKVIVDSIQPVQWTLNGGGSFYYTISPVPYLTTSNFNIVEVYYSLTLGTTATFYELPISNALAANDNLDFNYSNYIVNILYTFGTAPSQEIYVKIVIITQP